MPLEFIPTRADQAQFPAIQTIITRLQQDGEILGIDDGVLYYGWPKFQDYEAVGHPVDLALLSKKTGLLLVRFLGNFRQDLVEEADDSIAQAAATAEAQMLKSAALRGRDRRLKFRVTPLLYIPGFEALELGESEVKTSEAGLLRFIEEFDPQNLTDAIWKRRAPF